MTKTDEFIAAWKYEADGSLDNYHLLSAGQAGDCDDFAVSVAYLEAGGLLKFIFNITTFRSSFHRVTATAGEGHLVLRHRGKYIDNIKRKEGWRDNIGFPRKFPYIILPPVVLLKLILGKLISD